MNSREIISELIRKIVQCEEPYTYEDGNGQYYTRWGKIEKYLLSLFDAKEQRIAKLEEALRTISTWNDPDDIDRWKTVESLQFIAEKALEE